MGVGIAASRDCDEVMDAADIIEGKRDVVVVGFAFTFVFAVELVVGIVFLTWSW